MRGAIVAVLGIATLVGAVAFLLTNPGTALDNPGLIALAVLVGIAGFIGALLKIASGEPADDVAAAPWADSGAFVERAPERSAADHELSGQQLAATVEDAAQTARDEGTVAAGVEVVRPRLRETLLSVLVQSGTDRATAERRLAAGTWTEDPTAAALLDDEVDHPGWSLRERFRAWLFPERVLRRDVQTTMQAIAAVADRELATVPGQHAPRTVPVLKPTLADLQRGADGQLQRAVDPLAARSGSDVDGATVVENATTVDDQRDADGRDQERADEKEETETTSGRAAPDSMSDMEVGGRPTDSATGEVTRE